MIDKITINGVTYHVTPTTAPQLGDQVVTIDGAIYIIGEPLVEAQNTSGDIERARVGGQEYDIRDAVLLPHVQQNTTAIANEATRAQKAEQALSTNLEKEVTRAKAAEKALGERIDNIPTGGGNVDLSGYVQTWELDEILAELNNIKPRVGVVEDDGSIYVGTNEGACIMVGGRGYIAVNDGYYIQKYVVLNNNGIATNVRDNLELSDLQFNGTTVVQFENKNGGKFTNDNCEQVIKTLTFDTIRWNADCNLNYYQGNGEYNIQGSRTRTANDNMPILNGGDIEAHLKVIADSVSKTAMQILTLLNVGGGDGNIYTRTFNGGKWSDWSKLQTNVEVNAIGIGTNKSFNDLTSNGIYSGVNVYWTDEANYITGYEPFVLVVINGYFYGTGIAQLKYSTLVDGTTSVKIRTKKDENTEWTEWSDVGGGGTSYTLPIATADVLGGVKSHTIFGRLGYTPYGYEYAVNVYGSGHASVIIPSTEVVDDSNKFVTAKAVKNAIEQPIIQQTDNVVEIAPNVLNLWGEVAELDITLANGNVNVVNEYMFQFTSGATATTLVLPAGIKWISAPNIQANKTYQVSIINNLGVIGEFSNE